MVEKNKKIKENVEINVAETSFFIEDIMVNLNTVSSGKASWISPKIITGYIESIIVNTSEPISLSVYVENFEDSPLFEIAHISGYNQIPVRVGAVDYRGLAFEHGEKICLNDKIGISISGSKNTNTIIKLRIRKG